MTQAADIVSTDTTVVRTLLIGGPTTRAELQRRLGVSRPTISAAVGRLVERGLVEEAGLAAYGAGRNGRPQALLALRRTTGAALGIELGRTRVAVTVVTVDGSVHAQKLVPTDADATLTARLTLALRAVRSFVAAGIVAPEAVLGTGLAVTGRHLPAPHPADATTGAGVGEAPVTRGASVDGTGDGDPVGLPLARLRAVVPAPTLWDNNTRMAAYRHLQELPPGTVTRGLLYVTLSDGVSAGILDGTDVYRGGHGAAGELGHLCVDPAGPRCWCGATGCLEAHIGTGPLLRRATAEGVRAADVPALADVARAGDPRATALVAAAGRSLGLALASTAMLLDPRTIILSGPLAGLGELLREPAHRELAQRRRAVDLPVPDVVVRTGSDYDASLGAALQALHRWGTAFVLDPVASARRVTTA